MPDDAAENAGNPGTGMTRAEARAKMSSSLHLLDGLMGGGSDDADEDTETDTPGDQDPDRPSDDEADDPDGDEADDDGDDDHPAGTDDEGDGEPDEDEGDEDDDPFADDGDDDDAEEALSEKLTILGKDGKPKQVTLDEALRGKRFKVKVDGEESEVDFDEMRKGYIRQRTFSRRTEDLAVERKKFDDERGALLDQARTEASERLHALDDQIKAVEVLFGKEPNWLELSQKMKPEDLSRQRFIWEDMQRQVNAAKAKVKKEREGLDAKSEADQKAAAEKAEADRLKLIEGNRAQLPKLIPEWKDATRATREIHAISSYLQDQGIDPQVMVNVMATESGAAIVKVFRAAAAFERRKNAPQKLRGKKVVKKTKTQRAGSAPPGLIAQEQERKRSLDRQSALRTGDKKARRALMEKELGSFL